MAYKFSERGDCRIVNMHRRPLSASFTPMSKLDLLAGGLSGMTVDFVLFPIDTIKSRLQARQSPSVTAPKLGASIYRGFHSLRRFSQVEPHIISSFTLQDCCLQ